MGGKWQTYRQKYGNDIVFQHRVLLNILETERTGRMENLNIAAAADILTQQLENSTIRSNVKQSFDTFVYGFCWAVNIELKVSVACWTKN
jgi:hypothetical protein